VNQLKQLLTEYGYSVTENAQSIVTTCPICNRAKKLYLFLDTGYGKCMRCNTDFSPALLVVYITGCTWQEAFKVLGKVNKLKGSQRNQLPDLLSYKSNIKQKPQEEIKEFKMPYDFFKLVDNHTKFPEAIEYLKKRNIRAEEIIKFDLRYSPSMKRIIIPVYTHGKCVGWQGRDITGESELPYLSPSGFKRGSALMGLDKLNPKLDYIILSEGPFDFLKLSCYSNVVCSMGKQITKQQLQLIKNTKFKKIYLALDPDAFDLFDKIAYELKPDKELYLMTPPEHYKDFGECNITEIKHAFKSASKYNRGDYVSGAILRKD